MNFLLSIYPQPLCLHRRHTENSAPFLFPQLLTHDAVDARADRVASLVDQDAGVVVELDAAAVSPGDLLPRPYDHGVSDITALDLGTRTGGGHTLGLGASLLLHNHDDAIAYGTRTG